MSDGTIPPALVLCDWAEEIQGKLYIQGGGWTRIGADRSVSFAVALLWHVPWGQSNQPHTLVFTLVNEDGAPVADPEGNPVRIEGQIEVGRPPGSKQGSFFPAPLAIQIAGLVLPPGGYRFELHINGSLEAFVPFLAVGGTP